MIFDHFNINTPIALLEKTKCFYEDVFDLKAGFRPKLSRNGYWLYYQDKAVLHLFENENTYDDFPKNYLDHIAFQMPDIDDMKQRLADFNIEYRESINNEIHLTQLFFHDPSGVKIECIFKH